MASLLAEAQQQGLIDVFLVMVTLEESFNVPDRQRGLSEADRLDDAEFEDQDYTVDHWRHLDGSNPWMEAGESRHRGG